MKKVIITGAANGIGKAIAVKLLQKDITVLACDIDEQGLSSLKKEYPAVHTFCFDITNYSSVVSFFNEPVVQDANWLVNNAGVYPGRNILDYTPEEIVKLAQVNNFGAVYCTQLFAKPLLERKQNGAIVNISSVSGQHGSSDAIYGMTKAALLGLTKSTAINFAPYIRVNAVAPGLVATNILNNIPPERYNELRKNELLPHPIQPEDVAESVYFLLSDKAKNITGMTMDVNNGQSLR